MIICYHTNLLSKLNYLSLLNSAMRQEFTRADPHDGGIDRRGARPKTETCFDWPYGFRHFWDLAGLDLLHYGRLLWPEAMADNRIRHVELTKMLPESHFLTHVDMPYHDPKAPIVSFVYYLASWSMGGAWFSSEGVRIQPQTNSLLMYRGTLPHGVEGVVEERTTINGYFSPDVVENVSVS